MSDPKSMKRGLGRGLSALMADVDLAPGNPAASVEKTTLPIEQITANPDQPRRAFDPEALRELADLLRSRGILQPLIVRPHPSSAGLYKSSRASAAGVPRRWRSCTRFRRLSVN